MPEKKKTTTAQKATPRKKAAPKAPEKKSWDRAVKNTVLGLIWLGLGIISLLSFFPDLLGPLGTGLSTAMKWCMGATALGIPVLFLILAGTYIMDRHTVMTARSWCIVALYGVVSVLWSVFALPQNGMSLIDYLSALATNGTESTAGGGVLTGSVAWLFMAVTGQVGAVIFCILAILILLVFISGITFARIFAARNRRKTAATEEEDEIPLTVPVKRRKTENEPIPEKPAKKRDFDIPDLAPEETLSPADRRRLEKEQLKREEELNLPNDEVSAPRKDVVLSGEMLNEVRGATPRRKEQPLSPEEIDARAAALMEEEIASANPEPEAVSKEEIRAEAGQVAAQIAKEAEKEIPYVYPPLSLLSYKPDENAAKSKAELQQTAQNLMQALQNFSVDTTYLDAVRGPTVTRYELQPNAGVKISKITNLADDIALHLAASGVRIEAPIPGRSAIGIEIPNKISSVVYLKETISSDAFRNHKSNIAVALGKDIAGQNVCIDLAKMPHLLIAGSTGSGKSVCINTILMSILYKSSPEQVKLILVDPKMVELSSYNGIPHLLIPVVTEAKKAAGALQWAVTEMMQRYKLFAEKNVRNFQGYNEKITGDEKPLPQIVIIIDELADLMMVAPGEVEDAICRLAQMARAAGMHLVIATQRPSADVLTGLIKTNVPSRIAFAVSSGIDSRIILDQTGAEKLIGRGDMLYNPLGAPKPQRIQGCYVSDGEIEAVVDYIKNHYQSDGNTEEQSRILDAIEKNAKETVKGKKGITGSMGGTDEDGDYVDDGDDVLLPRAVDLVIKAGMASTSGLQRSLGVGHSRAGRLMDQMEKKGYIGPYQGSKPRDVLITPEQWNEVRATQGDEEE